MNPLIASRLPRGISRRSFLRAAGATLALPLLESLLPRGLLAAAAAAGGGPRRMVCICTTLGINAEYIFPKTTGRGYALTRISSR